MESDERFYRRRANDEMAAAGIESEADPAPAETRLCNCCCIDAACWIIETTASPCCLATFFDCTARATLICVSKAALLNVAASMPFIARHHRR